MRPCGMMHFVFICHFERTHSMGEDDDGRSNLHLPSAAARVGPANRGVERQDRGVGRSAVEWTGGTGGGSAPFETAPSRAPAFITTGGLQTPVSCHVLLGRLPGRAARAEDREDDEEEEVQEDDGGGLAMEAAEAKVPVPVIADARGPARQGRQGGQRHRARDGGGAEVRARRRHEARGAEEQGGAGERDAQAGGAGHDS